MEISSTQQTYIAEDNGKSVLINLERTESLAWKLTVDGNPIDLYPNEDDAFAEGEKMAKKVIGLKVKAAGIENKYAELLKPKISEVELITGKKAQEPTFMTNENLDQAIEARIEAHKQ